MKRLLLFITICISSVSFGQVVFDETYLPNPNPFQGLLFGGREIVEFNGRYLVSSREGLTSFDSNTGLNSIAEYQPISQGNINVIKTNLQDLIMVHTNNQDDLITKLDDNFNQLWQYAIPNTQITPFPLNSIRFNPRTICATSDNGCVIGSRTSIYDGIDFSNGINLKKLSSLGELDWNIDLIVPASWIGGINPDIKKIIPTSDGNYIGMGDQDILGSGSKSFWLFKFDPNGNVIWDNFIHNEDARGRDVIELSNGNLEIVGYKDIASSSNIDNFKPWLLITNSNGDIVTQNTYQSCLYCDRFQNITELNGMTYVTYLFFNNNDYDNTVFARVNNDLTLTSIDTAYISNDDSDTRSMITSSDDAIVFTGSYDDSLWIYKYKPEQTSITELNSNQSKELVRIVNLLGQETPYQPNTVLIYQYSDGTSEKVFTIKD